MFHIVEGPYLADILEQPAVLAATLKGLGDADATLADQASSGQFRRIVLTGMGSSFHALYPLHLQLTRAGYLSLHIETAELCLHAPNIVTADTLVVAVSQSGRSAEILLLLELAADRSPLLAITNDAGSPLAKRADTTILLHAGQEATVSCKTYVATLMVISWLAAQFAKSDPVGIHDDLSHASAAVSAYLQSWRAHVTEIAALVADIEQIYVTGRGPSLAAAGTAGLILKEATRRPAEGMSSAAFRHGPFEVLDRHVFVATLEGTDEAAAKLNRRLVDDVKSAGGVSVLVGPQQRMPAFELPAAPPLIAPILEILPFQLLSLAMAGLKGEEAGRFRLASKVTTIG